ncbi:metal binding domain of Ada-domain-containing protein [Achaetomium macrosporum]|uniref:Metal binding domain of Ada-domain-containing protein n=1 Tax=Achaetomium macrosporum TaxID=79813 RepID=A0AAN7C774_9PEZI|nr:metal binding domain of Ada-domain-containing protein [Achaetomium macrosporum]
MGSHLFPSDSSRWRAVQQRDRAADGAFVYAVKTTKIYCRPVCKARLARRANVSFYSTAREAEREGFRACKRCKPDAVGTMPEEAAIVKIRTMVQQELARHQQMSGADPSETVPRSVADMARKAKLSKWHFHRAFKDTMGLTPFEWFQQQQRERSAGSETSAQHVPGHTGSENACSGYTTAGLSDWGGSDEMADTTVPFPDPTATLAGFPSIPWNEDCFLLERPDVLIPTGSLSASVPGDITLATIGGYNNDSFLGDLLTETPHPFPDLNLDTFRSDPSLHNLFKSNPPHMEPPTSELLGNPVPLDPSFFTTMH